LRISIQTLVQKSDKKKDLIPKSFLQSGNDLQLSQSISFKHPTLQEVIDIDKDRLGLYSENMYYSMVNVFLTDPYDYMVFLDDKGIDYETVKPFDVFCMLFKDYLDKIKGLSSQYTDEQLMNIFQNNIYFGAFKFFLGVESFFIAKDSEGNDVIGYNDGQFLMDSTIYDFVTEFIRKINGIPEVDKINPEDEWAKQILIEDEREKLKKQAKKREKDDEDANKDRLGNLISSLTWSCNGGITPFNRNQLHMYDLIDGIDRTNKLLSYKNTMTGLYSGCVDKKKINFNELHWST
jgi:hypothetical protein